MKEEDYSNGLEEEYIQKQVTQKIEADGIIDEQPYQTSFTNDMFDPGLQEVEQLQSPEGVQEVIQ